MSSKLKFKVKGVEFMLTGTHFINGKWFHDIKNLSNGKTKLLVPDKIIGIYLQNK